MMKYKDYMLGALSEVLVMDTRQARASNIAFVAVVYVVLMTFAAMIAIPMGNGWPFLVVTLGYLGIIFMILLCNTTNLLYAVTISFVLLFGLSMLGNGSKLLRPGVSQSDKISAVISLFLGAVAILGIWYLAAN
jgi:hypothetical protein